MKRIITLCLLLVSAAGIMASCSRVDENAEVTDSEYTMPQEITLASETESIVSSETQTNISASEQPPETKVSESETSAETSSTVLITEPTETAAESTEEISEVPQAQNVDIDLTQMSSTIVFSEVYNMMMTPEDYQGKVIKMKGQFLTDLDTANNKRYYACLILDATACCAQGLGFVPKDGYLYPEDFPEPDGEITVTGTFDYFWENEYIINCRLLDADVER